MTETDINHRRVLAVDPTHRGFGFAIYEGLRLLVDWGVVQARGDTQEECLEEIEELIELYEPHVLVFEDCEADGSRRGERVGALLQEANALADELGVDVRRYGPDEVTEVFDELGADPRNKFRVGFALSMYYPPLSVHLPPKRKLQDSECERQAIFDAAALALTNLLQVEGHDGNAAA